MFKNLPPALKSVKVKPCWKIQRSSSLMRSCHYASRSHVSKTVKLLKQWQKHSTLHRQTFQLRDRSHWTSVKCALLSLTEGKSVVFWSMNTALLQWTTAINSNCSMRENCQSSGQLVRGFAESVTIWARWRRRFAQSARSPDTSFKKTNLGRTDS